MLRVVAAPNLSRPTKQITCWADLEWLPLSLINQDLNALYGAYVTIRGPFSFAYDILTIK